MSNFDPNAILRGAQLTLVGAHRALQNPDIFTSTHYRQAALAVCAGLAIRLLVDIPIYSVKAFIYVLSFIINLDHETWDEQVVSGLDFVAKSVLQIPFFMMMLMSTITPTLDHLFMDSLRWVDATYMQKHRSDNPDDLRAMYYPNLVMYSTHGEVEKKKQRSLLDGITIFVARYSKRAAISLGIYAASFLPVIGRFVLPAASFYTFNKAVGPVPAAAVFGSGLFLPKRYLVSFLQTYFSSRSLMRELLKPYFQRVRLDSKQKKIWFIDRSGVLFGFSFAFAYLLKIPLLGVLIYGIAEASTAYLITKITDPPPPPGDPAEVRKFMNDQVRWQNKHQLIDMPLGRLDELNAKMTGGSEEEAIKRRLVDRGGRNFA
ncbi:MAG: hypothetical protein Q9227_001304 [Pyrenula ochraceoflavens]